DPSLIVALKYNDGTIIKPNNINLYLAITSYSEDKNSQILEQIERKFGIRLLSEPSSHRPMETAMRGLFDIMVKCGSGVMDKLSDMEK
ncbi:hypothetical protein GOV12_05515, partial [Candidatus Pacearchaeota archaeon]|nr:hypothetical protein [Candidatus Pacearchaeota archaeon]